MLHERTARGHEICINVFGTAVADAAEWLVH
jgi:hypothetical protein